MPLSYCFTALPTKMPFFEKRQDSCDMSTLDEVVSNKESSDEEHPTGLDPPFTLCPKDHESNKRIKVIEPNVSVAGMS
jgi:hypothetical protein